MELNLIRTTASIVPSSFGMPACGHVLPATSGSYASFGSGTGAGVATLPVRDRQDDVTTNGAVEAKGFDIALGTSAWRPPVS